MRKAQDLERLLGSNKSVEPRESMESGPHVGLFYVVNGELYWEGIPTVGAESTPFFKLYPEKHSTYWKRSLVRRLPEVRGYGPDHFPRGRVVFDVKRGIYELMTDKCILEDRALVEEIIQAMGLPESKVTTSLDINCECPACKKSRTRHKTREELGVDLTFTVTEDGRKAFFPLKIVWPSSRRGYVLPSDKWYTRLRAAQLHIATIGVSAATAAACEALELTADATGSMLMGIVAFFLVYTCFLTPCFLWLLHKCKSLKRIDQD